MAAAKIVCILVKAIVCLVIVEEENNRLEAKIDPRGQGYRSTGHTRRDTGLFSDWLQ